MPVNAAHEKRKPWRNSSAGEGSISTNKQRDYVRQLEDWTRSTPVSDTVLRTMTRGEVGDYISTLKHRLDKRKR